MDYRASVRVGARVCNTRKGAKWREGVVRLIVPPRMCAARMCAKVGLRGAGRLRRGMLYDWETYVVEAVEGGRTVLCRPAKSQIEVVA